ncbi:MAG: hypothetical protein FJ147_21390 [Deltaproteobacteria bacterium]|nr:hypothetical protein [Deltaproteobacteria bacterium]
MTDLLLRRKWTLKAGNKQVVFVKRPIEHSSHVLMKAFLWALYLPEYPDLSVEVSIGDRYKPDVIARNDSGQPIFWGEAGKVGVDKIRSLVRRYRDTHFAIAKWQSSLCQIMPIVRDAVADLHRTAPFDVLRFSEESAKRFIDQDRYLHFTHNDVEWTRIW